MVMKKLIFLLCAVTFITVSFLSIKQFEYIQFQSFNNDSNEEQWNVIIKAGNPQKDNSENFKLLQKIAIKAKVNLQRVSYEKGINNEDKVVYYVAFNNANKYFKKLKLQSGKFLDRNSEPNDFLSTVHTNNKHQVGQLQLFHSFDPVEIRPMIAAGKTKDIKGSYTLNGEDQAKSFKKFAERNGFSIKILKDQSQSLFAQYPYQQMMYKGSLILCLLILLAMLYDVCNNYKEIAVRYMFGYNFWNIGAYLFKKYIKIFISSLTTVILGLLLYLYYYNQYQQFVDFFYFWLNNIFLILMILLLIFIVTWIGTKSINIPQMIKNKKPIIMFFCLNIVVRLILAIFLLIGLQQGISTFQGLKNTTSNNKKWSLLKGYSYVGVIATSGQDEFNYFQSDEAKRKKFQLLYKKLESQGAFYISPSAYYMNSATDIPRNPNRWSSEGKRVEINKNYLSINPIKDIRNKKVKIPEPNKNEITVLVPIKFKKYEKDIKSSIESDYKGIYNIKENHPVNVDIIYVKNGQFYFSYSPNMAQNKNNEIIDPIAVIVNYKFDSLILANNISRGYGFYIKNSGNGNPFGETKVALKEYGLNNIWQPVSVAYSNVELKIANNLEALQITSIYCGLFLILSAVLLFFSSIYYLEINKQSLALQWIFGYNFFEKHSLFYLTILVFWNLSFMICYFIADNAVLLVKITSGLVFVDILLTSILLTIKEYSVTKQVLIEK
jgi:putative ABC transport system permease protein